VRNPDSILPNCDGGGQTMPFHEHLQPPCPLENAGESTHQFTLWQSPRTNPDRHVRAGQSVTFSAKIQLVEQCQPRLL
jgi:hypothetical protein